MTVSTRNSASLFRLDVFAYAILIAVAFAGLFFPFGSYFDEAQHVDYAQKMFAAPELQRDFHNQTSPANWLAHPPFFYIVTGFVEGTVDLAPTIYELRAISVVMFAAAIAIVLRIGVRVGMTERERAYSLLVYAITPTVLSLAGTFNNDPVIMMSGALSLLGLVYVLEERYVPGFGILAGAFVIGGLTKLNGGFYSGLIFLAALWFTWKQGALRQNRAVILLSMLVCVIGILPYVDFLVRYGSVLPSGSLTGRLFDWSEAYYPNLPKLMNMARDTPFTLGGRTAAEEAGLYFLHMFQLVGVTWFDPLSEWTVAWRVIGSAALLLVLVCPFLVRVGGSSTWVTLTRVSAMATLGLLLAVYLGYVLAHMQTGRLAGPHARYVYPGLVGHVFLVVGLLLRRILKA